MSSRERLAAACLSLAAYRFLFGLAMASGLVTAARRSGLENFAEPQKLLLSPGGLHWADLLVALPHHAPPMSLGLAVATLLLALGAVPRWWLLEALQRRTEPARPAGVAIARVLQVWLAAWVLRAVVLLFAVAVGALARGWGHDTPDERVADWLTWLPIAAGLSTLPLVGALEDASKARCVADAAPAADAFVLAFEQLRRGFLSTIGRYVLARATITFAGALVVSRPAAPAALQIATHLTACGVIAATEALWYRYLLARRHAGSPPTSSGL